MTIEAFGSPVGLLFGRGPRTRFNAFRRVLSGLIRIFLPLRVLEYQKPPLPFACTALEIPDAAHPPLLSFFVSQQTNAHTIGTRR